MESIAHEARRLFLCNRARNPPKGEERWLSGYADASFHPQSKNGGWGAWCRDDETRVLASGPTPSWCQISNDAEMVAVCKAVEVALTHLDRVKANIMVIKTDCQAVARWFGWNVGLRANLPRSPENLSLLLATYEAVEAAEVKLVVTWVKGHNGTGDTKSYLNTQVDQMARRASRSQKAEFFKQAANDRGS